MSQTETLMLVALGFAAASFVSLVVGRVLWKLSRRIERRRIDREVPAVVAKLKADRDRLRAQHAMEARKFDMRLKELNARLAEQTAEVSRHRNRLDLLAQESMKREAALIDRETESKGMREQLEPLEAELARRTESVQALEQQAREKEETIARVGREAGELRNLLAERDRELVEFRAFADARALPAPQAVSPEVLTADQRLARRIEELTALSQQIASQRERFAEERDKFSALRNALALPAPPDVEVQLNLSEPRQRVDVIDEQGRAIEEKLEAAERESESLAAELRSLDHAWSQTIDELDRPAKPESAAANENGEGAQAVPAMIEEEEPKQRAAGNVVSLAARIKALQREASH